MRRFARALDRRGAGSRESKGGGAGTRLACAPLTGQGDRGGIRGAGDERRVPLSEEQWREEVDRRLNEVRPGSYNEDDLEWMEPVIEWAAANLPPAMRRRVLEQAADDDDEDDGDG